MKQELKNNTRENTISTREFSSIINNHFKQTELFNPEESQPTIHVYGCGSIGSHVIMGLAKIGIQNITCYDYDIVEEDNLPAQFYSYLNIDTNKVNAIKRLVLEFTGIEINTINSKLNESFIPDLSLNTIHIIAFDSIDARKLIFNKLKGFHVHIIDGRIGGFNYQKYYVKGNENEQVNKYLKTLEGEFSELKCGEKCLWGVNSLISSKIIADVIKITKDIKPAYKHIGNYMSDKTITMEN